MDGSCNVKCNGNNKESCGGVWRISVFSVDCSGDPEPEPQTPPELINPCLNKSSVFASYPFCDYTLSLEDRVADAVSRMTMAEKINALGTGTSAIPSLGLPAYVTSLAHSSTHLLTYIHTHTHTHLSIQVQLVERSLEWCGIGKKHANNQVCISDYHRNEFQSYNVEKDWSSDWKGS